MSAVHAVALALLTVAITACDQTPTAVIEVPPANLDFLNGPDDLPNVFRTATNAGFAMRDPSTGYIVMAGLPTPPSSITLCGGTMPFQTSSEMTEGELSGVLHDLRMGSDLNMFVYLIAGFRGVCVSTPFASGTGHAIRTSGRSVHRSTEERTTNAEYADGASRPALRTLHCPTRTKLRVFSVVAKRRLRYERS
jgi:hypothetical protein